MDISFDTIEKMEEYINARSYATSVTDIINALVYNAYDIGTSEGIDEGYKQCMEENNFDEDELDEIRNEVYEEARAEAMEDISNSRDMSYYSGYNDGCKDTLNNIYDLVCDDCRKAVSSSL